MICNLCRPRRGPEKGPILFSASHPRDRRTEDGPHPRMQACKEHEYALLTRKLVARRAPGKRCAYRSFERDLSRRTTLCREKAGIPTAGAGFLERLPF